MNPSPYIIAEIGFNHEGNLNLAEKMIHAAAESGAHAVKFQTFQASDILRPDHPNYGDLQSAAMSLSDHRFLKQVADDSHIDFLSTPFSRAAVDLLTHVGVPAFKVASMDCTNFHLLSAIADTGKPIYLSTGMTTLEEIQSTLDFLTSKKSGPVTLLHCQSLYPATESNLHLDLIPFLKSIFSIPIGYSDHYPGIDACVVAAMLGADVIETHFTLDAKTPGGDHAHSAEPDHIKELVTWIHRLNTMRGRKLSILNRPDRPFANDYRRGVYAAHDLAAGTVLQETDLLFCRPASDLTPTEAEHLIGTQFKTGLAALEAIKAPSSS